MRRVSADEAVREIARRAQTGGARIAVQGGPAEPAPLIEARRRTPDAAAGLSFCGLSSPSMAPRASARSISTPAPKR